MNELLIALVRLFNPWLAWFEAAPVEMPVPGLGEELEVSDVDDRLS